MQTAIYSLTKTRREALAVGSTYYFTGKPCKHGHVDKRRTSSHTCNRCHVLFVQRWKDNNPEYHSEYYRQWREDNPEYHHQWNEGNRDKRATYAKRWQGNNPDKIAEYGRIRAFMIDQAIPLWFEEELVKQVYLKRDELNEKWDTEFEVDHIVPLQGKNVCGLHCWANLQLLDKPLNSRKTNKHL